VLVGTAFGIMPPVETFSPTLFTTAEFGAGGVLLIGNEHAERAAYLIDGDLAINGEALQASTMAVLTPGTEVRLDSASSLNAMRRLSGREFDRQIWRMLQTLLCGDSTKKKASRFRDALKSSSHSEGRART
jgi:hypothetical protein